MAKLKVVALREKPRLFAEKDGCGELLDSSLRQSLAKWPESIDLQSSLWNENLCRGFG